MKKFFVIMAIMFCSLAVSCFSADTALNKKIGAHSIFTYEKISVVGIKNPPQNYSFDNVGIFWFTQAGEDFASTLAIFLRENKNIEVVSMAGDTHNGITVVFKERK